MWAQPSILKYSDTWPRRCYIDDYNHYNYDSDLSHYLMPSDTQLENWFWFWHPKFFLYMSAFDKKADTKEPKGWVPSKKCISHTWHILLPFMLSYTYSVLCFLCRIEAEKLAKSKQEAAKAEQDLRRLKVSIPLLPHLWYLSKYFSLYCQSIISILFRDSE